MEEMSKYSSYAEYKQELDSELQKSAEGFVKIGYLLKQARDTSILEESGYKKVVEFAQAEYSIDKTTVSRFIRINDKFSEGGNSDHLQEQYQGYGYAKLAIMLQLPDEVKEMLSPGLSKQEVLEVKEEMDAEQKVTDLEVMMEGQDHVQHEMPNNMAKALYQIGYDNPELYVRMCESINTGCTGDTESIAKRLVDILAPAGEAIYIVRVQGVGRIMMSIRGTEKNPETVNMRYPDDKERCTWGEFIEQMKILAGEDEIDPQKAWENLYEERFPVQEKPQVAPVQQKQEPKKQSKVIKSEPKEKMPEKRVDTIISEPTLHDVDEKIPEPQPIEEPEVQQDVEETQNVQQDEQLPGQVAVDDIPGVVQEPPIEEPLTENAEVQQGEVVDTTCEEVEPDDGIAQLYDQLGEAIDLEKWDWVKTVAEEIKMLAEKMEKENEDA